MLIIRVKHIRNKNAAKQHIIYNQLLIVDTLLIGCSYISYLPLSLPQEITSDAKAANPGYHPMDRMSHGILFSRCQSHNDENSKR